MQIKNVVMGIAILILTIFVTVYGINAFYERPEYEDFCDEIRTRQIIENEQTCIDEGGVWNSYSEPREIPQKIEGYCDQDYTCRKDYEEARKTYARNNFIIALPIGILIIILGAFLFNLESVGAGLMGGGVGTVIYGTWGFFFETSDKIRFTISLVGLIILIGLAYWLNKKFDKKSKKKVKRKK